MTKHERQKIAQHPYPHPITKTTQHNTMSQCHPGEVLVEAAKNGAVTTVRTVLEKLPAGSKVGFDCSSVDRRRRSVEPYIQ